MYKRMLRSVLAGLFSAAVAFGAMSGAGLVSGNARAESPPDSGWDVVQAGSLDSGWDVVQAGSLDSGWDTTPAKSDA
ncbi:hypothetical protein [Streptomyces spiramyceticus]|uniref:hypothetical protein n=1 Tax=Streptomyces spiramyceticus TaxID=299717 RepID=UPI00237A830D|nr:hypothetical protein [Streptomyces spiramyceticus]